MYSQILKRMREKIRTRQYIMTLHAEEEMVDDGLTIYDLESCILTGEIIERQKNGVSGEWKYLVNGESLVGIKIVVVAKLTLTGKLAFITTYRA